MRIQAELVKAKELKLGDLYSYLLPEYWDSTNDLKQVNEVVGEKVYIRTHEPWGDTKLHVFATKITIHDDDTTWEIVIGEKGDQFTYHSNECPHMYESPAGKLIKCRHKNSDRSQTVLPDCSIVYCPIKY